MALLMFIAKCVKPTKFFVNRLLEALREASTNFITVNDTISRDLKWFLKFLPSFNDTATYKYQNTVQTHMLAIDACLEGVGGVYNNQVYTGVLPNVWKSYSHMSNTFRDDKYCGSIQSMGSPMGQTKNLIENR